jgi:hypothetical protein
MGYPNVKNAHIVPACYLRAWECNGKLAVRMDGGDFFELPGSRVGTRSRAYRRRRPNGDLIDDVEFTLSTIEGDAAPLLATLPERWPLIQTDKSKLAVFFGFQIVRGPRWMSWADALLAAEAEGRSEAPHAETPPSTARLLAMLSVGSQMSALVGTMHWSLLEFRTPLVATSDHPMVIWRQGVTSQRPQKTPFDIADIACDEIRVPISPRHAILMTWCDDVEGMIGVSALCVVALELSTADVAECELCRREIPVERAVDLN